jgi:hypothetical protein
MNVQQLIIDVHRQSGLGGDPGKVFVAFLIVNMICIGAKGAKELRDFFFEDDQDFQHQAYIACMLMPESVVNSKPFVKKRFSTGKNITMGNYYPDLKAGLERYYKNGWTVQATDADDKAFEIWSQSPACNADIEIFVQTLTLHTTTYPTPALTKSVYKDLILGVFETCITVRHQRSDYYDAVEKSDLPDPAVTLAQLKLAI